MTSRGARVFSLASGMANTRLSKPEFVLSGLFNTLTIFVIRIGLGAGWKMCYSTLKTMGEKSKKLYNLLEEGIDDIMNGNILTEEEMDKELELV
jgi:hypothetical protein